MRKLFTAVLFIGLITSPLRAGVLQSVPSEFDFGWAPEDAHISCDFMIKNTGDSSIALNALKPACGCTAAQFTPMNLTSAQDTKVSLTFNTRGYKGLAFHKSAQLEAGLESANLTVYLRGTVLDPNAKFLAIGNGVASFEPDTKSDTKTITLKNKTGVDLPIKTVQEAASWASVKLKDTTIKADGTTDVEIKVKSPYTDTKETSTTFEIADGTNTYRATLAIRTGPAVKPYQPIRPVVAPTPDNSKTKDAPTKTKKKHK